MTDLYYATNRMSELACVALPKDYEKSGFCKGKQIVAFVHCIDGVFVVYVSMPMGCGIK